MMQVQDGTIVDGLILAAMAAFYLFLSRSKSPSRFIVPAQRWSSYGSGARLIGLACLCSGVLIVVMGLLGVGIP